MGIYNFMLGDGMVKGSVHLFSFFDSVWVDWWSFLTVSILLIGRY